jgi:hypothetical protein
VRHLLAYFNNSAQANSVIQLLVAIGVPSDRLGVTPPDRMPGGQGMLLSIPCPDPKVAIRVESICRQQGAELFNQNP